MTKQGDKPQIELPESPASVTARVVTDQGFPVLFTLRDLTGTDLLEKFEQFQRAVLAKGWKPEVSQGRPSFSRSENGKMASQAGPTTVAQQATTCAKCGAPAIKKSGLRKDKTEWVGIFCSTGDDNHKLWLS